MARALSLFFLILAALAVLASAQCLPVDPAVVNKTIRSSLSCDRLFGPTEARFSIEPWGIFYKPLFTQIPVNELVCPEDITSLFRRKNMPPMVLWRPAVKADFFKKSHPALYAKHLDEKKNFQFDLTNVIDPKDFVQFPCETVKVQRITRWGPQQKLFVSLVKKMVAGIKAIRDHNCQKELFGDRREVSVKILEAELASAVVGNNALAYLYNLAYSNFFCV